MSNDQIIVDRNRLSEAVDELMSERYGDMDRAEVERALWHWLQSSIDKLIKQAATLTHSDYRSEFHKRDFQQGLTDLWLRKFLKEQDTKAVGSVSR
ncbi:MAG: hypothetical protein M1343_08135 [Chloroflexi bacterium]|nr:hypothetical protein [Chloroflexota bacterium]